MNKRGLFGKIFLILGIIIGLAIAFLAITVWQVYSFIGLVKTEQTNIKSSINDLQTGDCKKVTEIESSLKNIENNARSICKNPLIKSATEKINQLPIKCSDVEKLKELSSQGLAGIKSACLNATANNKTISN